MIGAIMKALKLKLRFSLLSYLVVLTLGSTGIVVWLQFLEPLRRQAKVAERLMAAGVTVEGRPSNLPYWMTAVLPAEQRGDIVTVKFNRVRATDDLVRALTELPYLERLYMEATDATDDQAIIIAGIPSLRRLALWSTRITDKAGQALTKLENLEIADLKHTGANWRTTLAFQDHSNGKVKTNYSGLVYLEDFADLPKIARLNPPVRALHVYDLSKEQLIQCCNSLKHLTHLTLHYRTTELTPEILQTVSRNARIKEPIIWGYDLPNRREVLQSICKHWGPKSSRLEARADQTYVKLLWFGAANSRPLISFYDRCQNIQNDGLTGEDFASLEGLQGVKSFLLTGHLDPRITQIIRAVPNVRQLTMVDLYAFSDHYYDAIAHLTDLESITLRSRLHEQPLELRTDFLETWMSLENLQVIELSDVSISSDGIQQLAQLPQLTAIWSESGLHSSSPDPRRNILPELKSKD